MSKNIHDETFKKIISNKHFFVDFCRAYLPEEIQARIDWQSPKIFKLGTEFVKSSQINNRFRNWQADVIYKVVYDSEKKDCFITIHAEHQSTPSKYLALRRLNYTTNFLTEYAEQNPKKPLPPVISIIYYHGKPSPYPYSLDIFDLFENKSLAKDYFLNPILVDLKQLSPEALAKHGSIFPIEALFRAAFEKKLPETGYELFFKAMIQEKSNEFVLYYVDDFIRYALNVLKVDENAFEDRFIEMLPELEDRMRTIAKQLEEKGLERGMQQGVQQGIQQGIQAGVENVVKNMLRNNFKLDEVAKISGLDLDDVQRILESLRNEKL